MPSERSINKFREIYQKEFGVDLTVEQTIEQIKTALPALRIIFQPMPKKFEERYNEFKKEMIDDPQANVVRSAEGH